MTKKELTARSKILVSLNIELSLWQDFKEYCQENDKKMSPVLARLIQNFLDSEVQK